MSALELNSSSSMLPLTGGTIHAMSGGFMSSPYTGSDSYDTSLLRALPPSAAPIAEYKGGGGIYARGGVIRSAAQSGNNGLRAAPASMSNASSAAVAISAASNAASNAVPAPEPVLLANPSPSSEDAARVAVATSVVASDLIDSNDSNDIPSAENDAVNADDAARVAVAISAMPHSSSSPTIASETDPFTTAAIAVTASSASTASSATNGTVPKSDKKMKTITVHGINYDVTDPAAEDNEGWKKLLAKLRLDRLKDERKEEIKQMIYDEPTCLEKDFPVSSLMTCAPIRFIIENVLIELLHSGKMDDSKSEYKVVFDPQKDVEALSKQAAERPVEARGGARKARQRRIIRKHT